MDEQPYLNRTLVQPVRGIGFRGVKFEGNGALSNGDVCYGATNYAALFGLSMGACVCGECRVNDI